jgi:hypothetical protein
MGRRRGSPLSSAQVKEVGQQVAHWRRTRRKRSPMPPALWNAAVSLARTHGVCTVPVGTPVARRPPHRSQRALLTHWAPASDSSVKALFGPRMPDLGRREPASDQTPHACPVRPVTLTAPLQGV